MLGGDVKKRVFRGLIALLLVCSLSGCLYWIRAYQTYLQFNEFDRYFSVSVTDAFTLHFNDPILLSQDFVALSKLYASDDRAMPFGRRWRYRFFKVDKDNQAVKPTVSFYSDMNFNKDNKLTAWSFSKLFLEIAPPKFLESSLRSLAGAEIDKEKQQLRAKSALLSKITEPLPKKEAIIAKLGAPLSIEKKPDGDIYLYRFLLETHHIEEGYEKNAVNEVRLSFDNTTQALFNMAGNFAGLKISINYRSFLDDNAVASH